MDQFSALVQAQKSSGGSIKIVDSEGVQADASVQKMYDHGLSKIGELRDSGRLSKNEALEAEAGLKLGFSIAGSGAGFGAGWKAAMSSASDESVQKALGEAMSASYAYAEKTGVALSNTVLADTSSSNSKAESIASGFTQTATQASQSIKAYKEVEGASSSVGTNLSATVPQIAAKLGANATADRMLTDSVSAMRAREGSSFDAWVTSKQADWNNSGASFANQQQMAELLAVRHFGDDSSYARILSNVMTTSDLSSVNTDRYSGVASHLGNGAPISTNIGSHDGRVEQAMPGMAAGSAIQQSSSSLQARAGLAMESGIGTGPKTDVLTGISAAVEALPKGGFGGG